LFYKDLPGTFKSSKKYQSSLNGEIWLENELFQVITISQVYNKATVIIAY